MKCMSSRTPAGKQGGAGLIEILVTLFILAVGLLGVAALQFTGSFANRDAISRTQAEFVAAQVVERLRIAARPATVGDGMVVNNAYFDEGAFNFSGLTCTSSTHPSTCYCLSKPAAIPNCEGASCSEVDMAQYDGWVLSCAAVQTNPNTQIALSCTDNNNNDPYVCSPGSRIEVNVNWPVASSGQQQYTLNARCNNDDSQRLACVYKDIVL